MTSAAQRQRIRCAIYTRKSTDEGLEKEFNSLDAQRESAEAFITSMKHEGWICLPEHYDDGGYTGGNMERPALKRLMADIHARNVDVVVVYKVDRLSRSLLDFARMMDIFDKHGISFVSVTQQFNTTHSMGRLTLNILLSFAQFEREIISERTRDKIAAARREGKWVGGHPILGYDVVQSKLVENECEAVQVRQIFELFLQQRSCIATLIELERRDWRNKAWITHKGHRRGGRPFNRARLQALLTNVAYVGKVRYKSEICPGEHTGIIPDELFEQVQRSLALNTSRNDGSTRNRFGALLKGLIRCVPCNASMVPHHSTRRGNKRYRYYTCSKAQKRGWHTCPSKAISATIVEQAVVDQIRRICLNRELQSATLREFAKQTTQRVAALEEERRTIRTTSARSDAELRELLAVPVGDSTRITARMANLQSQIQRGEFRLDRIRQELDSLQADPHPRQTLDSFDAVWSELTTPEQMRVIQTLIQRIDYDGRTGELEIHFHEIGIHTLEHTPPPSEELAACPSPCASV